VTRVQTCALPIFDGYAPGSRDGSVTGRQGIARPDWHVHHAAALDAVHGTHRPFRVHVIDPVAVIARVGIDERGDCPALRCQLRFDSAPGAAILCDDNLALNADPEAVQQPVIL